MSADVSRRRAVGRVVIPVLVALGVLLGGAVPASAHPTLLFTDPTADTAVPATPQTLTLVFNEAVTVGPHALSLLDSTGRVLPLGPTSTAREGTVVTARTTEPLPPGTYVLRWQATGTDGDLVNDEFRFAVGTAVSEAGTTSGQSASWGEAALRWWLFAGFAVAFGGIVGERFTASARAENAALRAMRSLVVPGALLGLAAVVGLGVLLIADTGTTSALWLGSVGRILLAEALGFAAAAMVATLRRGRWRAWAALPLAVVAAAEGLRAHANVAAPGWGALLTGVHLAAAAVWAGTLLHLVRAVIAWRRQPPAVRWVLAGYLRLAAWVFVVVVATGVVSALLLVPLSALGTTTYGQVLLIKLAVVALAVGLAFSARLASCNGPRLGRARRLARLEAGALVGVLAISAVLVSTPPAGSRQPVPPPARGLVVPLGTVAGQVGVSAAISDGQLVVRLSTPQRGDAPTPDQDYRLSGHLTTSGHDDALAFHGCGQGCFVAPAGWRDGDNVLTLRVDASGWRGGTASWLVPWPARPGSGDLARTVAAMRAADHLTVYETVTSDTTTPPSGPQRLDLNGSWFLSQEPYASGVAPIADRISPDGQPIRLALSYPAAFTNVTLTLDAQGRISEEILTDSTHLIHRRFVYPDPD